jgi:hypothetical protein
MHTHLSHKKGENICKFRKFKFLAAVTVKNTNHRTSMYAVETDFHGSATTLHEWRQTAFCCTFATVLVHPRHTTAECNSCTHTKKRIELSGSVQLHNYGSISTHFMEPEGSLPSLQEPLY